MKIIAGSILIHAASMHWTPVIMKFHLRDEAAITVIPLALVGLWLIYSECRSERNLRSEHSNKD